jgi:PTH1 family peptidyl-tRNA hydrolase
MKIIIGLGNPEKEYEGTRHNVGFFFADKIKSQWNFPEFEMNKKLNSLVSKHSILLLPSGEDAQRADEGKMDEKEILLVKPQTFMNLSGEATKNILDFYKLTSEDIIVIHDDLDIAIGKYRIATDSSSAGHNGVQNLIEKLGTQKFKRIRIGIGAEDKISEPDAHLPRQSCPTAAEAGDFVLQKFSPEELEKIEKISDAVLKEIEKIL